ncbi:tetratricopeptide repeat protein 5 [Motacilla alba alba]|uniref:tetratricopeptide repeat protein 5 n=1 Tax=Motacilla alba alba TaxID=1094192 RepID=UPI0018D50823|nr:tetratricopeptide repeat protein 5 [Motacilla alba alba]
MGARLAEKGGRGKPEVGVAPLSWRRPRRRRRRRRTAAGGRGGDEEALKRLEALVTDLYRFRDTLPARGPAHDPAHDPTHDPTPDHAPDHAPDPAQAALVAEMERTLQLMEQIHVSPEGRGRALVLRARALGVAPEVGGARAELALGHALKLDPALGVAWRQLGEQRWRRGDIRGARQAFGGALQQGEDPEARRLLSMALRAQGAGPGPRGEGPGPGGAGPAAGGGALRESLAQAEAAVRCDPRDGQSWYVLGNAHVSLFFAGGQSPGSARRALAAYAQAERVDPEAAKNPDLHLNRATLLQFLERFQGALEGLSRAAELAPGWAEPRTRHRHLVEYLGQVCQLLETKGKLRGKRRRGLAGPVPLPLLGPLGGAGGPRPSPIAALRPGPNPQRVVLGRALFTLAPPGGVPYTVGLQDGGGAVAAVTVYNSAPSWGVAVGDAVGVAEPLLTQHLHQHQGQTFSFLGLRVPSPLSLVVNGKRPPGSALAPPRLALTNPSAPPGPAPPPAPR